MGLQEGRKYLRDKKIPFLKLSLEQLVDFKINGLYPQLDLDFLGSFYVEARDDKEVLSSLLQKLNKRQCLWVYLDGEEKTMEKQATHLQRARQRLVATKKLHTYVSNLSHLDGNLKRSHHNTFKRLKKAASSPPENLIDLIPAEIKRIQCFGEADVRIASIESNPYSPRIAISGDSDLLYCRNADWVAIPYKSGKSYSFILYEKDEICSSLGLSRDLLVGLAICSTNDYRKSLRGFNIGNNIKVLKEIEEFTGIYDLIEKYADKLQLDEEQRQYVLIDNLTL